MSLANDLSQQGHDARPIEGAKSQFDVVVDGGLVFSKQREGRFPERAEILTKIS